MANITENYYYKNRVELIAIGKAHNADWRISVAIFDEKHGLPKNCDELRNRFFTFVHGKRFDDAGNITGFYKKVNGQDVFMNRTPTAEELAALIG